MKMIIKNGYLIDPAGKKEGVFDILIEKGKIKKVSGNIKSKDCEVVDAKGKIVLPGLIDMHVHLREPGREDNETVKSGTEAAISGGITSVCTMPNTNPPMDNGENVNRLTNIIKKDALSNVFVVGAITEKRCGEKLVDMKELKKEGVIALSDDGNSVQDEFLMLKALKKAKDNGLLLISHCEDKSISKKGVVNEGVISTKLGLRGIPKEAEYNFVGRDIKLAGKAGARIHIAHVSSKESVDIIRKAKKGGIAVTAETAPHYFSLSDEACVTYDTRTKMNPPLHSVEDAEAIKKGLADGTIDAIASDHAPHGKHEKEIVFELAAFGIIGLETLLGLSLMKLIDEKRISWMKLAELISANPAKILGLDNKGCLSPGSDADLTIIDPEIKWVYKREDIKSKSKNSPFIGREFKGRVKYTIVGGRIVFGD
jgi:dihydroorotase